MHTYVHVHTHTHMHPRTAVAVPGPGGRTCGLMRPSFCQERGTPGASPDLPPPPGGAPAAADFPTGFLRGSPFGVGSGCGGGKEPSQREVTLPWGSPEFRGEESPRPQKLIFPVRPGDYVAQGEEPGGHGRGLAGPSHAAGTVTEAAEAPG